MTVLFNYDTACENSFDSISRVSVSPLVVLESINSPVDQYRFVWALHRHDLVLHLTRRLSDKRTACVVYAAKSATSIVFIVSINRPKLTSFFDGVKSNVRRSFTYFSGYRFKPKIAANHSSYHVWWSEAYSGSRIGAISRKCPHKDKDIRREIGHNHRQWKTNWR